MAHLANHTGTRHATKQDLFIGFTAWVIGAEIDGIGTVVNAVYLLAGVNHKTAVIRTAKFIAGAVEINENAVDVRGVDLRGAVDKCFGIIAASQVFATAQTKCNDHG